jgi:hypothetical protein
VPNERLAAQQRLARRTQVRLRPHSYLKQHALPGGYYREAS